MFLKGNTPMQIKDELGSVYGASSVTPMKFSAADCNRGRTNLGDDERL